MLMTVSKSALSPVLLRQLRTTMQTQVWRGSLFKVNRMLCSTSQSSAEQASTNGSTGHMQSNVLDEDPDDADDDEFKEGDNILDVQVPPGEKREMVEMWNKSAPNGPEWGGPRGYEPTKYGDWARNGRVSDF